MPEARTISRLRKFVRIGPRRRWLLADALVCLLIAMALLRFIPFQKIARRWGPMVSRPDGLEAASSSVAQTARVVGWAVRTAARPLGATCLRQAMAARAMLKRRGIGSLLHFGVCRDEQGALQAHAWLDVGGVPVTGYPLADDWSELGSFVTPSRPAAG